MISNQDLRERYLSPQMHCYFRSKLAEVPQPDVIARIEEALKFLSIAHLSDGNIAVSQEIDDIWHYWILETQEYARLCALLPTGRFLHHRSNTFASCAPDARGVSANTIEEDVAMLANYVLNFGPFEDDRIRHWRMASRLVTDGGMSVDQLNKWLDFETVT